MSKHYTKIPAFIVICLAFSYNSKASILPKDSVRELISDSGIAFNNDSIHTGWKIGNRVKSVNYDKYAGIFPDKIGDSWTYLVNKSGNFGFHSGNADTVHVAIIGRGIYQGDSVSIWQFNGTILSEYNHSELWVKFKNEKINIYEHVKSTQPRFREYTDEMAFPSFNFPLKVEDCNKNGGMNTTTEIIKDSDITVKAGTFKDSYKIKKSGGGVNCYMGNTFWFKENIGFVKFSVNVWDMCSDWANGDWELISYHLK